MIGTVINNKYRIVELLNVGGMSKVYLAKHVDLDTNWAVKVIDKKNLHRNYDYYREVDILKNLSHRSLPRIIDISEEGSKLLLIEDYIDGINLRQLMLRVGTLRQSICIAIGYELAAALKYLHKLRPYPIIYGDMKPSNVIIDSNGFVKLIDFGISKIVKPLNEDRVIMGTPLFAAPETIKDRVVDKRSDIYSLCLTLMYLITKSRSNIEDYRKIINNDLYNIIKSGILEHSIRVEDIEIIERELKELLRGEKAEDIILKGLNEMGYSNKGVYDYYGTQII